MRTSGSTNGRDFLFVDLTGLPVPEYRDIGGEQGELNFGSTPTFFYNGFSTIDFLPPVTLSEAEPNNDAGTSQLVPLAAVSPQTAVIGDLSTGTDVDRFQVIVAADRTLRVVVTSTGSGPQASLLQPRLGLFDAAGTLLQSVDATFVNGQWTAMLSRFTGVTATFIVAVTDFGDVNFDGTQGTGDGIAADSGNYSLRLESVVEAFVHPQPTATLSTGTGDGAVNVLVSASGVFEGADYDPIGAIALNSTTFLSDVAVRILGAVPQVFFLSQAARNAVLTVTPDGVSSTFDAGPLRFTLFQSVLPVFDGWGFVAARNWCRPTRSSTCSTRRSTTNWSATSTETLSSTAASTTAVAGSSRETRSTCSRPTPAVPGRRTPHLWASPPKGARRRSRVGIRSPTF